MADVNKVKQGSAYWNGPLSTNTNFASTEFERNFKRGGAHLHCPGRPGAFTAKALGMIVLAGVALTGSVGGGVLTRAGEPGWTAMMLSAVAVWSIWLLWRNARDEVQLPAHVLHPFLALPVVVLLGHMLSGAHVDADNGRIALLAGGDGALLIRLMALGLMLLLAQDVLSRVHDLRWLLTGLGTTVAVGCVLQLHSGTDQGGAQAVTLTGFAAVGMLLAPCLLPALSTRRSIAYQPAWVGRAFLAVRIIAAAFLAALLAVANRGSVGATCLAAAAAGGALLAAGAFLRHPRRSLLAIGGVLVVSGTVGLHRLGMTAEVANWSFGLLGVGPGARLAAGGELSGLHVLGVSAGWVGLAGVMFGMLAALGWSLSACRNAAPGDQARAALWSAVVALSGCALLAEGGLAVPAAMATAAITWGMMPHIMAHRVRRFHGWPVVVALAAALMVLGLGQRLSGTPGLQPAAQPADKLMHFLSAFVLAEVLFWQMRCRRWWHGLGAAAFAAGVVVLGEPLQERLSERTFEWSDVTWDALGAAAALGAFVLVRTAMRVEKKLSRRRKIPAEKYQTCAVPAWRRP